MVESVIRGIANALHSEWPAYPVHDRETPQGTAAPAFSVRVVRTTIRPLPGGSRWNQRDLIEVIFFPTDPENRPSLNAINQNLGFVLEVVEDPSTGYKYRGRDGSGSISDGALVYTVTYDYNLVAVNGGDYMDDLSTEVEVE